MTEDVVLELWVVEGVCVDNGVVVGVGAVSPIVAFGEGGETDNDVVGIGVEDIWDVFFEIKK